MGWQQMSFDLLGAQKRVFASNLRSPEKLVALALLDHWSKGSPEVFPSIPTLQLKTGLGRTAVVAAIRVLEAAKAVRIQCKRPTREVDGRREVVPNAKLTNHYDLSGLMSLPGREANQCATSTGSGGAPVREGTPTRSRNGALPVREAASKEPRNKSMKEPRGATSSQRPPKKPSKKGWRRVPESWEPRDEERQLASRLGVDFDEQLARYRDHTYRHPMLDPDATFRNWLRKAGEFRRGPRKGRPGPAQQGLDSSVVAGRL